MFDYKGSHDRSQVEKTIRYSIRKVSFGAASVAVAALFMFLGNGAVSATEQGVPSTNEETQSSPLKDPDVQNGTYGATPVVGQMGENSATSEATDPKNQKEPSTPTPTDVSGSSVASSSASATEAGNKTDRSSSTPSTEEVEEKARPTLDKKQLEDYVAEIDAKLASGSYATKTDESVATLKEHLELAKLALTTAKSQEELTKAYRKLLMTASSGLRNKPKAQVESPKLDTTEGKVTVGKKASNTEKATESNSIANSGQHDPRNRQALDRNNPFRTDGATTDTDSSANQTYTAPAENADLKTLATALSELPDAVENNKKIQDMDDLGDKTNVARGEVKEIQEFGGWKAIAQPDGTAGKFAIARKTEAGVFPIETVNTVYTNLNRGQSQYYDTYVGEQAFDRTKDYMLFLGKVRTIASENEKTFNGKTYQRTGLGGSDSFGIKSFSGIEKTFKAHSPATGSKVKVSFKTGYTGDLNGTKAKYLVEVVYRQNGSEVTAYTYTFAPQQSVTAKDGKGIVTPAKDGTGKPYIRSNFNNYNLNRAEVEAKMAEDAYKPNGQAGTFTSSDIDLPIGVTDYTVRIKVTDTNRMGMGYQSPLRHYALPVTGTDFSIEQDTGAIAKDLLSRIYDKLKATESADTDGKTNETKAAYLAELENIKTLVTSADVKKTAEYKKALESTLSKQLALRVDKTGLTESKTLLDGLVNEDPTPGKTQDTATAYNAAKQEAIKAIEAAKTVIDNENATVAEVRDTLETVNAKQKALQRAEDGLIEAATAAEKAKLKADVDSLIKADTTDKTPKSIDEYNKEFKKFEQDFNSIKTEVSNIIAKGNNATKAEVDTALSKVAEIKTKLDTAAGLLVDKGNKTELEKVVREESTVKGNFKYYNADKTTRDAYDEAIKNGQTVIADANADQTKVNAALTAITEAKNALDGAETNKRDLQTLVDEAANKATNAKYYNADQGKKDAYDNAIKAATGVLNKPNVTQAEIDGEKDKVETAKNALDGAETNKAQLTNNNDVLNELILEDPTNGKTKATIDEYKKVKEESEKLLKEIKKVIDNKNASQIEVNKALEMVVKAKDSLENAKKSLLDAVEAREVVETIANEKIASIKADKKLSVQEKEKAIDRVDRLKEKALEEIDKSKKQTEIDKALRTFLYQMDQDSLVYERPSFDLEAFIQSSITGVVTVERGKAIRQADVIAKLNLPENVTVISIDLPDTNTLGDKFAKVTLRLADGKEITVKVPVRVVAPQNGDSKPDTSLPNHGANNGSTNTDAKVDKAKLEGAIRQLDELIIRESAKLDAETAKEANALSADAKKVFANADTSQAEVDAMIKRIEDFMAKVALSTDHATPTNDQAAQTPAVAPATTQAAANAGQTASAQASVRTVAKELPNTGTVDSVVSMVVAAASALLGLGLAGRRRKEDEEA